MTQSWEGTEVEKDLGEVRGSSWGEFDQNMLYKLPEN